MTPYPDEQTSQNAEIDHGLLERYWCGETTSAESAEIEAWRARYPDQWAWYEQLRQGIRASARTRAIRKTREARVHSILASANGDGGAAQENAAARDGHAPILPVLQRRAKSGYSRYFFATAAALVVAFVAGLQFQSVFRAPGAKYNTIGSVYSTAAGQRASITLPDQSDVILNVGSRLETASDYSEGNRVVYLKGEAMFTVRHHSNSPFTVISENGRTEVLGTQFVVRKYPGDTMTIVTVKDGRVRIGSNTTLSAGQQGILMAGDRVTVQDAELRRFQFADGILDLPTMKLTDAIEDLNRWYNTDIRLGSPALVSRTIGGTFTAGSISDLIDYLERLNFKVQRDGHILTLLP